MKTGNSDMASRCDDMIVADAAHLQSKGNKVRQIKRNDPEVASEVGKLKIIDRTVEAKRGSQTSD
jgi:hypothetical protein